MSASPNPDFDRCNATLRAAGRPNPRTCAVCGLGRCRFYISLRDQPTAEGEPVRSPGYAIGESNREAVRTWFLHHVGCTNRECAKALGLSEMAVGRHIATLRQEWQAKDPHP